MMKAVSVPLRGYGFEMLDQKGMSFVKKVSVPLRGYGFEILTIPSRNQKY